MNASTSRHALRKKLLSNGYLPLPLLDKGVRIKGWSRETIDEAWLERFARSARFANTGLRCDGLAAFDIDVLDEGLADEIEAHIEDALGPTELCRIGQWPKRLLLYRLDGPGERSARTGRFAEAGHCVELLTGSGRQFAAFGVHPKTHSEYLWENGDPLSVPIDQLPSAKYQEARHLIDEIDAELEARGLARHTAGTLGGGLDEHVYDLQDDTPVEIDGEATTWGALRGDLDKAGVWGNLQREDGAFGDSGAVHFYLSHGNGQPCAHDFPRDCTHWDSGLGAALATALPPAPSGGGTGGGLFDPPELTDLLEHWVLLKDRTVRHIDEPARVFELAGFKAATQHLTVPAPSRQNPLKTDLAVNVWQRDPRALRADYAALCPYSDAVLLEQGSLKVFNTYRPPTFLERGGDVGVVLEFIEHLIPGPAERELFWDWHALKLADPSLRLHGLVMVTPSYGTGRGTWTQILRSLFGLEYVNEVPFKTFIGVDSQGQYTEWLSDALIVSVPEAYEDIEGRSKWATRHAAYERLKTITDTTSGRMWIQRKTRKNTAENVYASVMVQTNHIDALAIEPGDRRLIVLANTRVPLTEAPGDLLGRIHDWRGQWANVSALARWLGARLGAARRRYDPMGMPPMTGAKERMIETGQSDVDMAWDWMVEHAKGDVVTASQWKDYVYRARDELALELPDSRTLQLALDAVARKRGMRPEGVPTCGIKIKGKPFRLWIIRNFAAYGVAAEHDILRSEVLKNGDPTSNILLFPNRDS